MLRWTSLAVLLLSTGCASTANTGSSASPDAGEGSTNPTTDGGAANDAATSAPDGGSDSGGGDGAASKRLSPMETGYTWTYDVENVGIGSVCTSGSHDAKVLSGPTLVSGKQVYEMSSFCLAAGPSRMAPDPEGDRVELLYNGGWHTVIDPDLTDGHTWTYFNSSYTWHKETSVTVPAGTFDDCWTAKQNVTYTAYMTYCRGAGMVRSYSKDLGGNGWDAKLTKKNF